MEELHPEQHEAFKKSSGIEAKDIKKPSAIWKHFRATDDPKKHKCVVSAMIITRISFSNLSFLVRLSEFNFDSRFVVKKSFAISIQRAT